jgi:pimeloyl-ACP methyl ester carboxylesterase
MSTLERDGIRFNYEVLGEGPAVVFCHGLTGDLEIPKAFIGSMQDYRLVFMDCRAHGRTEPVGPPEKLNFNTFAEDYLALVDHLGIDRFILGGISMGAGVTARFASLWPERLQGIVLVRPAWLDKPLPENLAILPKVAKILEETGLEKGAQTFGQLPEFPAYTRFTGDSPEKVWKVCEQPGYVERRIRLDRIPKDCPISSWEEVEKIEIPALVIGSQRDATHPWEFAVEWAQRLPNAELVEIPPKWENDDVHSEAFHPHLKSFLDRVAKNS